MERASQVWITKKIFKTSKMTISQFAWLRAEIGKNEFSKNFIFGETKISFFRFSGETELKIKTDKI